MQEQYLEKGLEIVKTLNSFTYQAYLVGGVVRDYIMENEFVDIDIATNATPEQIQAIYAGEITNWNQVGGKDEAIIAYQRPVNSGSQTGMLNLVMKDKKIVEAPKENIAMDMTDIIDVVSDYENNSGAIGYSYYYYANTMYLSDDISLLSVNGVEPNNDTIKAGEYPIQTAYYIVIRKDEPENSKTRELVEAMLSTRGQLAAENAGYVPLGKGE